MKVPAPTRRSPRRFDSIEQEAFLNLWRTYDRLRTAEEALFSTFGLTPQQYNALRLLRARHPEGWPTLALQSRLVSRAPDITRLLDHLESRHWIERRRAADRRVVQAFITAAGLELLAQLDEPVRQCHHRQLGHLNAEQLRTLVELLTLARAPHEADNSDWNHCESD